MLGANYSWIEEPYKSQILEVLKLAQPFEDFYETFRKEGWNEGLKEGRDEGLREGRINGRKEDVCRIMNRKFGLQSLELQNFIKAINNETVLIRIIEEVLHISVTSGHPFRNYPDSVTELSGQLAVDSDVLWITLPGCP